MFEVVTWPELERICHEAPKADVSCESRICRTWKNVGTAMGQELEKLCKEDVQLEDVAHNI
jgi:hypothetical protein